MVVSLITELYNALLLLFSFTNFTTIAINFICVSLTSFASSKQVPPWYENEHVVGLCVAITSYCYDRNDDLYPWNTLNG